VDSQISLTSCTACSTKLPSHATTCPACDYPVNTPDTPEAAHATQKEYKLIQLLGVVVTAVGVVAALADSPIAAAIAVIVGIGTYLTGLVGARDNFDD